MAINCLLGPSWGRFLNKLLHRGSLLSGGPGDACFPFFSANLGNNVDRGKDNNKNGSRLFTLSAPGESQTQGASRGSEFKRPQALGSTSAGPETTQTCDWTFLNLWGLSKNWGIVMKPRGDPVHDGALSRKPGTPVAGHAHSPKTPQCSASSGL
jgi:hypothetical protein